MMFPNTLSVLQWSSIVVLSSKNYDGVHFVKQIFFRDHTPPQNPPKNSSKCLLWLIVCHSSNTIFGDWTDPIITVIIIPCCWPTHLTCSKSVCFNCLPIASENDPNEFPMPPNLRIDTKIRLVGCSEPKLQVWPCYGNLSGHNGHICHLGHCDVSKNGHKEFPIPQNLGIDTKITFLSCSEVRTKVWPFYSNLSGHEWPKITILAT